MQFAPTVNLTESTDECKLHTRMTQSVCQTMLSKPHVVVALIEMHMVMTRPMAVGIGLLNKGDPDRPEGSNHVAGSMRDQQQTGLVWGPRGTSTRLRWAP